MRGGGVRAAGRHGGRAVQMNGRGYYEVAGLNRPQGWNAWLTFSIALNKSDK